MVKSEVYGYVKDGKLTINNRKRLEEDMRQFKNGPVMISVKRKNKRSNPQNRYYWGVIVQEIKLRLIELGNEVDEETVHEFLKGKFNPVSAIDKDGVVIAELPGSTADLNKEEFSAFVELVIRWAAEILDLQIPYPNEDLKIEFK